jgi:hypothetical protein
MTSELDSTAPDPSASGRARTGALLAQTREERNQLRARLDLVEILAARHLRGDEHGPQGAAAREILEALSSPTRWTRLDDNPQASAEMLARHAPATVAELGHAPGMSQTDNWLFDQLERARLAETGQPHAA